MAGIRRVFLLMASLALTGVRAEERRPLPAIIDLELADDAIRAARAADLSALALLAAEARRARIELWLQEATALTEPAAQVANLRLIQTAAAAHGESALALQAIDVLSKRYEIDLPAERLAMLGTLSTASAPLALNAARAALSDAGSAMGEENFGHALAVCNVALRAARRANDPLLIAISEDCLQQARELSEQWPSAKAAMEALKATPNDPQAQTTLGRFRAFLCDDWAAGRPLMAAGNDPELKALAEREITETAKPSEKLVPVADGWWQVANKQLGRARPAIKWHAAELYRLSLPSLAGDERERVQSRIRAAQWMLPRTPADPMELAGKYRGVHPNWTDTITLRENGMFAKGNGADTGAWTYEDGTLTLKWKSYAPESVRFDGRGGFSGLFRLTPVIDGK